MKEKSKRAWVKNAAIIFLLVLLVLTFLSNTIMNRSLPEVATQYVSSGQVTTRIRGSGVVTANEVYEVKLSQSRTVQSVAVHLGDEIEVGDTLLYLSGDFSEELTQAQHDLADMELAYEKALIQATASDYASQNREIQNARTALQEAEAERDALGSGTATALASAQSAADAAKAAVDAAQIEVDSAQTEVDTAQAAVTEAEQALGTAPEGTMDSNPEIAQARATLESAQSAQTEAQSALNQAQVDFDAIRLQYGDDYDALKEEAEANRGASSLEAYMKYLSELYALHPEETENFARHEAYEAVTAAQKALDDATDALTRANDAVTAAQTALSNAESNFRSSDEEWNSRNAALTAARAVLAQKQQVLTQKQATLRAAQTAKDQADAALESARADNEDYQTAVDNVKACRKALEDAIFALQEQQKADGITSAITALDLQAQKDAIDEKQAEIDQLKSDSTGQTLTANVAGTISSIDVTAGSTTVPDTALMTIEIKDCGYSLSFSVTQEQSRKLRVGDPADVTNYYWGSEITATLTSIKNDPENPQTNKILTFAISGDVEAGSQLTLSVGQRSADYDMIVPNSALRSDTNGDYVLIVVAKSSPLGNRYIAQRADVQILAKDDTNAAVTGALSDWDYVITTSSSPIEAGMQVRLAE